LVHSLKYQIPTQKHLVVVENHSGFDGHRIRNRQR
jgi:hypothetical protein